MLGMKMILFCDKISFDLSKCLFDFDKRALLISGGDISLKNSEESFWQIISEILMIIGKK